MFTWNGCWCHERFSDARGFAARETSPLKPGKSHKKDINKKAACEQSRRLFFLSPVMQERRGR
ncbi:hypothetical protein CRH11_08230 [Bacillus velezensis]|nr:hypothetical protein SB24_06905 [Bacillus sp. Pc3]AMR49343.1 hypothetical protein A1R12_02845 [Bacillus amyloliquefaciens]ASP25219.1 hypothetical protein CG798_08500 [Bacillus velezensis]ATO09974.1 hypothetical protein CRH11_08230 [Bacillus velezensis]MBG9462436.1 hypothetical protein [Bacillus amyloliquefaciens]